MAETNKGCFPASAFLTNSSKESRWSTTSVRGP
jgi:hypothetical protein